MNTTDSFKFIDILFRDNPTLAVKHHLESYNIFFGAERIPGRNVPSVAIYISY